MPQRRNSCGLFHHVVIISFRRTTLRLILSRWHQPPRLVTLASIWTATCQWDRTLHGLCVRLSVLFSKFAAFIDRCHVQHCWHSSPVSSCLDVAVASLPRCDLDRLQSFINAAACLTVGAQCRDHFTPLLADSHWLQMPQRIQYKLCILVYLQNVICPVTSMEPRHRLRSALCVISWSERAADTTFNNGRPRLHGRWITSIEQSERRSPSQFIACCLQTFFDDSLVYTVFYSSCFRDGIVATFYVAPSKWLFCLRHSKYWLFYITLHYTLVVQAKQTVQYVLYVFLCIQTITSKLYLLWPRYIFILTIYVMLQGQSYR